MENSSNPTLSVGSSKSCISQTSVESFIIGRLVERQLCLIAKVNSTFKYMKPLDGQGKRYRVRLTSRNLNWSTLLSLSHLECQGARFELEIFLAKSQSNQSVKLTTLVGNIGLSASRKSAAPIQNYETIVTQQSEQLVTTSMKDLAKSLTVAGKLTISKEKFSDMCY